MKAKDLKLIVKEKYGKIAKENQGDVKSSCCGTSSCCSDSGFISMIGDDYSTLDGYNPDADMGLGCGIPTHFAGIKKGHSVLDLGSGAGNDCFVARAAVGPNGHVTGLDFTEEMIDKARQNALKLGFTNVDFVYGDIEDMPLSENTFDVVVSNCVLNLVPDKSRAFSQIMRVLKSGGHFCVSDVVLKGELTERARKDAELYAGCVSGALQMSEYLSIIEKAGFTNITIHKERRIELPDGIIASENNENGIFSITVSGYKI
jgi:SAM-dependent methyltransferase